MKKNGKYIKCKTCNEEFYLSRSRFSYRKYCSFKCAREDNFGFKEYKKNCVICDEKFTVIRGTLVQKKTCSIQCHNELARQISGKRNKQKIQKICSNCQNIFTGLKKYKSSGLCEDCRKEKMSKERKGKGNPAYKYGLTLKRKYNEKHLGACKRYRKIFTATHSYLFCESCKVNSNGTPKFEVHHICSAGKFPKHKNLHHKKNLIFLCIKCHNDFHSSKRKKEYGKLVKQRGLDKLFNIKI